MLGTMDNIWSWVWPDEGLLRILFRSLPLILFKKAYEGSMI